MSFVLLSARMRLLVLSVLAVACNARAGESQYLSPTEIVRVPDQKSVLVACHTASKLLRVDLPDGNIAAEINLPDRPTGMTISSDGSRVYATAGVADGLVLELDGRTLKILRAIHVGHTPMAPVLHPDGQVLFVCHRFQNEVVTIDLRSGNIVQRAEVAREPIAACLSPDGAALFVANHLPIGRADRDYMASEISVIDSTSDNVEKSIQLVNGAQGIRDMQISPDGKHIFATHLVARFHVPTSQVTRGWINTNGLSVIDVERQELVNTVLLDDVDRGFANPWGVAFSSDGSLLAVSGSGTNEVSLIDCEALMGKLESVQLEKSESGEFNEAYNDLAFLHGVRKRITLAGKGPRALCFVENDLYVAEYFSDTLCRVPQATRSRPRKAVSIPLGPELPMTEERLGEFYFSDASLCLQQWQSCASCHPDARMDGLNWDLLNDGLGNPKNAKSMLLAHATPPAMALGIRADAETAVRAGIRHIQFAVRPEKDAQAIDTYLKSLKPVPSPYLVDGELSPSALRGKLLFEARRCSSCHPAPLYTDLKSHNLRTGIGLDTMKPFDTPTLVELWRTAPYMHDGRSATVEELLRVHPRPSSGSELSEDELRDLAEFLLSL